MAAFFIFIGVNFFIHMYFLSRVKTIAFVCVVLVFLIGTTTIAFQFYQKSYDDLPTFYWATHLAFDDRVSAYQPQHFQQLGNALGRKIYPFLYPPPSLLLFSPFLFGSYEQCKLVFTVCNLILWWLLAWVVYRLYCFQIDVKQHRVASFLVPLWLLCFIPVWDTFRTGQTNLIVLMCAMLLFFDSSHLRRQILGGVVLALIVILKVYLLLVLPILLILHRRVMLLSALITLMLLCVASYMLLPANLWTDWIALSSASGGYGKQLPNMMTIPWNQSINGFFIRQWLDQRILSGTTRWPWFIYVCSAFVIGALLYTTMKKFRNARYGSSRAMALTFLSVVLIAPLTWLHHFTFAIPAIVCCFALLSGQKRMALKMNRQGAVIFFTVISAMLISVPSLIYALLPVTPSFLQIANNTVSLGTNVVLSTQLFAATLFFALFCSIALHTE